MGIGRSIHKVDSSNDLGEAVTLDAAKVDGNDSVEMYGPANVDAITNLDVEAPAKDSSARSNIPTILNVLDNVAEVPVPATEGGRAKTPREELGLDPAPSEIPTTDNIRKLAEFRRDKLQRKTRERMVSEVNDIELRAYQPHDPLDPTRPYGMPEEMEGCRRDIWESILAHVNDLNSIANLREVCSLFRDFLERKYVAARFPEVIEICLENKIIPWDKTRTEESAWSETLRNLRGLSKVTKHEVDILFDRGLLENPQWNVLDYPYYATEPHKVPTLRLGALDIEQRRLETLENALKLQLQKDPEILSFPFKALIFDESRPDMHAIDLEDLREAFHKLLGRIGNKITSFEYGTLQDHSHAYNSLSGWVGLMPNLEELMIRFVGGRAIQPAIMRLATFPTCPNLKRYAECSEGFGFPYLNKIFRANPTIKDVTLGRTPSHEWVVDNLLQLLDNMELTRLQTSCMPRLPLFLKKDFHWTLELTDLVLMDPLGSTRSPPTISSRKLFRAISKFENLVSLLISSPRIRDTGGYLELPKLKFLHWKAHPNFKGLEFLKPLENLFDLDLNFSACPDIKEVEDVMQLLADRHIVDLFPALAWISMATSTNLQTKTVRKVGATWEHYYVDN